MKAIFALTGAGLFLVWTVVSSGDPKADQLEQIRGYKRWTRVTKEPVHMQPFVERLCRPTPAALETSANPHVPKKILVYVNEIGRSSMRTKSSPNFPVGSVIVKEKFDASKEAKGEPEFLTVMVKGKPSSSPASGDWSFYTTDGKGKTVTSTDIQHCIKCHAEKKRDDWVFRGYGTFLQ